MHTLQFLCMLHGCMVRVNPSHVFHYFPLFNKDPSTFGTLTSAIRSLLDVEIQNRAVHNRADELYGTSARVVG
jgi:hypothetical protein